VELHDPQGATLGPQRSVAFAIADDEPTPQASLSGVTVREGAGRGARPARPAGDLAARPLRVLAGRVRAGAAVLRPGLPRLFGRR
jgi:hypothetical protein